MSGASPSPSAATVLRSLLFLIWVWGLGGVMGFFCLPLLAGPRGPARRAVSLWARLVLMGLRSIVGVRVEVRGLHHLPPGGALIAAKHMGMLDIIPPLDYLSDPCLVMKRELMRVPVFGWFSAKLGMIVVDREAQSAALRSMVRQARVAIEGGRQVLIFPEGTRKEPGDAPDYKPGVAALYRDLGVPCVPLATNSGACWPARGFIRHKGVAVFEFLPALPSGLKRASFMAMLEEAVETASARLRQEAALEPVPGRVGAVSSGAGP